jgi:Secretion system C-terminal sorting domain
MPLTVYPNPNPGKFYVELDSTRSNSQSVELFDSSDKLVYSGIIKSNKTNLIELKEVKSGNYSLCLKKGKLELRQQISILKPDESAAQSNVVNVEIETPSLN